MVIFFLGKVEGLGIVPINWATDYLGHAVFWHHSAHVVGVLLDLIEHGDNIIRKTSVFTQFW